MSIKHQAIKDAALIAVLASILFVQQLALSFLPNIQFSMLLVVLYTKVLGFKKTSLIVIIHVMVINILSPFGPVIPMHIPSMLVAWLLVPILLTTVFKKVERVFTLASLGFLFGFIYGWAFIPVSVFVTGIPFMEYLYMDLVFELIMAVSNFLTIYWLYEPLKKMLISQRDKYYHEVKE